MSSLLLVFLSYQRKRRDNGYSHSLRPVCSSLGLKSMGDLAENKSSGFPARDRFSFSCWICSAEVSHFSWEEEGLTLLGVITKPPRGMNQRPCEVGKPHR